MRSLLAGTMACCLTVACADSPSSDNSSLCAGQQFPNQSKIQLNSAWSKAPGISTQSLPKAYLKGGTEIVAVIYDACSDPGRITSSIANLGEGVTKSGVRSYKWAAPTDLTREELAEWVNSDACVQMITDSVYEEATQDMNIQALPADPLVGQQLHLNALGASEAYETFYHAQTGINQDVIIAIVDSGVELNHEDLRDSLWVNQGEIPNNGIDDDKNGYVDDVYGYNFASNRPSPTFEKTSANSGWQYAHGTKVAGLAAATAGNGRGVTGIMGTAKIMALNNMGRDTSMAQADTANSIRYAVDNGAEVINLSLGSTTTAGADLKSALQYATNKGVVVLAAAGNGGTTMGTNFSAAGQAHAIPGLISVGNIKAADFTKSPTSNFSSTYVELSAPGTYTTDTLLYTTGATSSTNYSYFSGTSAAVPVASGAAGLAIGLIKSRGYGYTAGDIEALLLASAKKVDGLKRYFKDGNALDLASLARTVDSRYPYKGSGMVGGKVPVNGSGSTAGAGDCAAL